MSDHVTGTSECASLMQNYNTVCALAVELRNDIRSLVTAALGSWDDEGDSVEQVRQALGQIHETAREASGARALQQQLEAAWQSYELKVGDLARENLRVSRGLAACDPAAIPLVVVGEAGLGYAQAQEDIRAAMLRGED